jgi:hypothetical membrane protein
MRPFVVFSAAAAPVLLIGGWTLAQSRQPAGFDPLRDTISGLAAIGATDRGIMTVAFIGLGLAYLVTAAGLSEARRPGRLLIGAGGVATVLVALFPQPGNGGSSTAHTAAATTAFLALAIWPFFGANRDRAAAAVLRPPVAVVAGVVLLALVAWFGVTLRAGGLLGLAERAAAGAQAIWPFVVALGVRSRSTTR